jgi:energy-coupling factor transporter transmembrane protein EcfT
VARAREIADSQRARGLDTEGAVWRRMRGVVPLAGPLVFSALTDVEEQTMALEARGFSAPERRTVLRSFGDTPIQRHLRLIALGGGIALLALSIAGGLGFLP